MMLTERTKRALERATELHAGQYRKGTGLPYIVHPYSVASILSGYTDDEDVIVAGLLHDVLEDVPGYGVGDMEPEFGARVTSIVMAVTEQKDPGSSEEDLRESWRKRKEGYLTNLRTAGREALMVAAANKIHNLWSVLDEYDRWEDDLWRQFHTPPDKKLWFFEQVLAILKERLDDPIVRELEGLYSEARDTFRKYQPEVESVSIDELGRVLADEFRRDWKPVRYWLMKSEPETFSIDDLAKAKKTAWEGVRNYQARNFMRDRMRPGDLVLFYHSNARPSGVAGIAKVVSGAYPDHTAWDRKSPYYDPRSTPERPVWFMVDIAFVRKFDVFVPLETLRSYRSLGGMPVVRPAGRRLSVQPVRKSHFRLIERLGSDT
jgi:predicted RNA-binding protein with PUA-like domain